MLGFIPEGRWNASIEYDKIGNRIYIFGGSNLKGYCNNDLYSFEMSSSKIQKLC